MSLKSWLHGLQPVKLYIIIVISIVYFFVQLFLSHITHALTLLVDSYHMLCNIIALYGSILTITHNETSIRASPHRHDSTHSSKEDCHFVAVSMEKQETPISYNHELKLRNTFGWTRIGILAMLVVCILLASLSFSLLVEAVQTLIHIGHQDTIHHTIPVLILGITGLIINGICYILIGGYTFHQKNFLQITSSHDDILDNNICSSGQYVKPSKRLSTINELKNNSRKESCLEIFRDISSTIFVIFCSTIVYFSNDEQITKFIDPIISIFSCIVLLLLSYPDMKESCLILLQTIPASIDIEIFKRTLLSTFKDIDSVHDLHIWQLTASKYVSTVHIIFQNPVVYIRTIHDIKNFFHEQGITILTIQPEFKNTNISFVEECMVQCNNPTCAGKYCCQRKTLSFPAEINLTKNKQEATNLRRHHNCQKKYIIKAFNTKLFNNMREKSKSTNNLDAEEENEITKKFSSEPYLRVLANNTKVKFYPCQEEHL